MTTIQLANLDARLTYLALQYHLARPGSELDAATKQPVARGLAEVAQALAPQLQQAVSTIELTGYQHEKLVSALAGTLNELKTFGLLASGGRSASPAFESTLRRLFPEVAAEPEEATALAGHIVDLRRRLERAAPGTPEAPAQHSRQWWRFWGDGRG